MQFRFLPHMVDMDELCGAKYSYRPNSDFADQASQFRDFLVFGFCVLANGYNCRDICLLKKRLFYEVSRPNHYVEQIRNRTYNVII